MKQYPKWKYHATEEAEVVESVEEETAMGAEWVDHPSQLGKPETCPAQVVKPKPWKKKKHEGKVEA